MSILNFDKIYLVLILSFIIVACNSRSIKPSKSNHQNLEDKELKANLDGPPFEGTIFVTPNIITKSDPSTFQNLEYKGQESRTMFDWRVDDWITVKPFLFHTTFDDGLSTEIQVNPEFNDPSTAKIQALKYAEEIGKIPTALRRDVETVWIHKGTELFGGGNNNLLIHIGQSVLYEKDGILEETLLHEGAHTSLDADHATSAGWKESQKLDDNFISVYAKDNPQREDIAETFPLYLALKFKPHLISDKLKKTIEETIPNRIKYLDAQSLDMYPIIKEKQKE